jgi:hypothetical protein
VKSRSSRRNGPIPRTINRTCAGIRSTSRVSMMRRQRGPGRHTRALLNSRLVTT